MRFSLSTILAVALAADSAIASSWFGKTVYNKWHETELERWLSDHNVPYPTPADRKDLENLIKTNWNEQVVQPYNSWDTKQLQSYLQWKGADTKKSAAKNKDSLVSSVKGYFTETDDQISSSYSSTKDWILDSWTESQLKAFLDRNGIPSPQPRTRDSLLKTARENYQAIATKLGETAAYPGNWLYESWSESDLKEWCDLRGIPVPQPSNRDKLIASVRRNSRLASNNMAATYSSATASASSAAASLSDALFDSWSDSQIKAFLDKNGVKVPQGSKKNELIALARKHSAKLSGDNVSASAASAYGAATSSAGNQYAQATDDAALKYGSAQSIVNDYYNWALGMVGLGASSASSYAVSATDAAASAATSSLSSASKSLSSAKSAWSKSAVSATDAAGTSASSSFKSAESSWSSASSSLSKAAISSASSLSSAASSASSSASKAAYSKGPKEAKKAGDAASESIYKGKHRVQEAYQQATDRVKEEL